MVVFDGVRLTHEKLSKEQAAAIFGLGLVATGTAAAVATPASAMLGHVTKSITQQARTYRADIGNSDKDDSSSSADTKDSSPRTANTIRATRRARRAQPMVARPRPTRRPRRHCPHRRVRLNALSSHYPKRPHRTTTATATAIAQQRRWAA